MAKYKKPQTYYEKSADNSNKRLNLTLRSQEKVYGDFEVYTPTETEETREVQTWSDAPVTAPTINPPRPRAKKIAYSQEAQKLVVRFRDGTWWEYNEIPVDMWNGLKSSNSTGRYLAGSGLDQHDNMGPFNPNQMPEEIRVLFNS
jgi:hypothetical protein